MQVVTLLNDLYNLFVEISNQYDVHQVQYCGYNIYFVLTA